MRLRSFVIVFIVLLFLLGGIMQVFLWNKERSVSEEAAKVETKEKLEAFKDVVALKSEFYRKFIKGSIQIEKIINPGTIEGLAESLIGGIAGIFGDFILILIYIIFLLSEMESIKKRMNSVYTNEQYKKFSTI